MEKQGKGKQWLYNVDLFKLMDTLVLACHELRECHVRQQAYNSFNNSSLPPPAPNNRNEVTGEQLVGCVN